MSGACAALDTPKTSPDGGLDWNLLRPFATVVQEVSLSKAADRPGLIQPTLGRREADIAIRFARSVQNDLIQRRVASQRFGFFASRTLTVRYGPDCGMDDLARYPLVGPLRDEMIEPVFLVLGVPVNFDRFVLRSEATSVRDTPIRAGDGAGLMPVAFAKRDPALEPR